MEFLKNNPGQPGPGQSDQNQPGTQPQKIFPRKIYKILQEHIAQKKITILTGLRGSGKTTIIKKIFEEIESGNKIYCNLEHLDEYELWRKGGEKIIAALSALKIDLKKKSYIVLDEIRQENVEAVKYLYDHYEIKLILVSSNFTDSFEGRGKIFTLRPLDFGEFLDFKKESYIQDDLLKTNLAKSTYWRFKDHYEEYLEYGGFPEVVLAQKIEQKKEMLNKIFSMYVHRDAGTLLHFRKGKNFFALLRILGSKTGQKLDHSKLARTLGISRPTVKTYIEVLEKTHLISIMKVQKIFFSDNGILNTVADPGGEAKFRNAIFTQLRQKGDVQSGRNIDFMLDKTGFKVEESPMPISRKKVELKNMHLIGRYLIRSSKDYVWGGQIT